MATSDKISRADLNKFLHQALQEEIVIDEEIKSSITGEDGKKSIRWVPVVKGMTKGQRLVDILVKLALGYEHRVPDGNGGLVVKIVEPNAAIVGAIYDRVHGRVASVQDQDMVKGPDLTGMVTDQLKKLAQE